MNSHAPHVEFSLGFRQVSSLIEPVSYVTAPDAVTAVRIRNQVPMRKARWRFTIGRVAVAGWIIGFAASILLQLMWSKPHKAEGPGLRQTSVTLNSPHVSRGME